MPEKALIIHPVFSQVKNQSAHERALDDVLTEIEGLADAIHLETLAVDTARITRISPSHLFGKGIVTQIGEAVAEHEPDIVIVNHPLSPVQQRNLERSWKCKVIDRTGLILEIFGERAETREGRIQVELAALEYQRSRLVRSWTHLERQRGGAGFMGGPGETQIEVDRRMIADRIAHLKKELEGVRKTRELGRKSREKVPFPIVALVGYTNAGKSTLFNRLTGAGVFAEDLPFATLDPTLRQLKLPSGQEVILSDTVGFISDLPTHLVAAFRATLEQVQYADIVLHVRDVSRGDHDAQKESVVEVLKDLGIDYESDERIFEAMNKIDACAADDKADILRNASFGAHIYPVSALSGEGLDELLAGMDEWLARHRQHRSYVLPSSDGKALSWLYQHAEVIKREERGDQIFIHVHIEQKNLERFENDFGYSSAVAEETAHG